MRNDKEYQLCHNVAYYIRAQYPNVKFRFDMAGLNLSEAQAGKNKAIQCGKGWPDLFIARPVKGFAGCFIELKTEGTKLFKKYGGPANPHVDEQNDYLIALRTAGDYATFAIGFVDAMSVINNYLNDKL